MWSFVIALIVSLIIAVGLIWDEYGSWKGQRLAAMGYGIVIFFISAIVLLVLTALFVGALIGPSGLFGKKIDGPTHVTTEYLANMSQFEGIHGEMSGSFLYVHGSVDNVTCYGYYVPMSDGGLSPQKICSELVTVYESDEEDPRIETSSTPSIAVLGDWTYGLTTGYADSYKIYVPQGTVTRDFNLGFPSE